MVRYLSYLNSMRDIVYKNIKFQFIQKNNSFLQGPLTQWNFYKNFIPLTDKIEARADLV